MGAFLPQVDFRFFRLLPFSSDVSHRVTSRTHFKFLLLCGLIERFRVQIYELWLSKRIKLCTFNFNLLYANQLSRTLVGCTGICVSGICGI